MHLHIEYSQGFLYINPHFSMVATCKHPLFPFIFNCKRTFLGDFFVWNHTGTRKKSKKINSQNSRTLFQETFISRTVFLKDFFSAKTLFPKLFFKELFCGYLQLQTRLTAYTLHFWAKIKRDRFSFHSFHLNYYFKTIFMCIWTIVCSFELLFVHLNYCLFVWTIVCSFELLFVHLHHF